MAKFDEPKETKLDTIEESMDQIEVVEKKNTTTMNFIERFLDMISKHGIKRIFEAMLLVVLVVFLSIFTFNPDVVFKAYDDYKSKEHAVAMQERIDNTPLIQKELEEFRVAIGASRAWIFELHNSTNSLDGMPFLFASMTYETVAPALNTAAFEFDNIRLSLYKIVTYLRQNEFWCGEVSELEDIDRIAYQQFRIFNLGYGGMMLLNVEGAPNAVLCFAYNDGCQEIEHNHLMGEWTRASYKINGLLTLSDKK